MVVTLPGGEDPDSLLRRDGAAALARLLEDAVDLLERKLQILERKGFLESIEGKRRAVDGVLSTLRAVRDPALRDIYLGRAAERIGVRRETLVEEVARSPERPRTLSRSGRGRVTEEKAEKEDETRIPDGAERSLLLLLQRDSELTRRAGERGLRPEHFRHPVARAVYEVLEGRTRPAVGEDGAPASETASDARSPSDVPAPLAAELERLAEDSTEVTHPGEVYEETLRRVLYRGGLERLAAIDRELEMAEEDQARRLLEEKARVARELREAGVPLSFLRSLTGGRATAAGR
jgi:DNA primase